MKYSVNIFDISENKKTLLIISGLHGNETNAIVTTMMFQNIVKNTVVRGFKNFSEYGKIIFLIGVNEYGIRNHTRNSGILYDTSDLNRLFYEEEDYKSLLQYYIGMSDVVIDVHNTPMIENCVLLNYDDKVISYRKHFMIHNVQTITWIKNTPTVKNFVNSINGKKGFTVELNSFGDLLDNVNFLNKVVQSVIDVNYETIKPNISIVLKEVFTQFEGILFWDKSKLGKTLFKDEIIGDVCDYSGNILCYLKSPCYGILMFGPEYNFVNYGDSVFGINPVQVDELDSIYSQK